MYDCIHDYHCFTGENKSYYCIFPVSIRDKGRYYCRVKNEFGEVNSAVTTVTVSPIIRHPSLDIKFRYAPMVPPNKAFTLPHTRSIIPEYLKR